MEQTVHVVFNYGGRWFQKPHILYQKNLTHEWRHYDVDLLSYIDLCQEFKEYLRVREVVHILVTGPSGRLYIVDGDEGIRKIQSLVCSSFKTLNLFAVDNVQEGFTSVPSITQYSESENAVDVGTDCDNSDEVDEEDLYESSDYDSEEVEVFRKQRRIDISDKLDKYKVLENGMTFKNLEEAKQTIAFYAVANKRKIGVKKSDKTRVIYICQEGCPFYCFISREGIDQGFKMKKLCPDHTCDETFDNPRASSKILGHYFKKKVQNNPEYKVKDMRHDLVNEFSLEVNDTKLKRAKRLVLEKLDGSYRDDFNKLEGYASELRYSNPGSDIVLNISKDALEEGIRRFLRLYICFHALKEGWKRGLRPLIGLDGTFLKGKSTGILLVAVGQDANNHFYPLAWAVVDRETKRTWTWFVQLLKHSLDLKDGEGVTFMSDMQKGLLEAVKDVLPNASHRWCVKHIEGNWGKKWRSGEMHKYLWWAAWSTYDEEFKDQLREMGKLDVQAAKALVTYPPEYWSRAYFDTDCKNMMVDNNFTESFNSWIVEERQKPIIKMLEGIIRVKVMNRIREIEEEVLGWKDEFSLYAMDLYKDWRTIAQKCTINYNGGNGYEVTDGNDRHKVTLDEKACICRQWELSGIPCPHAIKALNYKKIDPVGEIDWYYSRDANLLLYNPKLQPVRGEIFWKVESEHAMEPPSLCKMVGRPKVKRTREKDEARKRQGMWSVSRKGLRMTCGYCSGTNHNIRKCPLVHGKHARFFQDEFFSQAGPQNTPNSEYVFIPTPGITQQNSQASAASSSHHACGSSSQLVVQVSQPTPAQEPSSQVSDLEHEADPVLRPRMLSERETRYQTNLMRRNTGARQISFKPGKQAATNIPYSPKKVRWKGKQAVTSTQLQAEKEKKIGKLQARRGRPRK